MKPKIQWQHMTLRNHPVLVPRSKFYPDADMWCWFDGGPAKIEVMKDQDGNEVEFCGNCGHEMGYHDQARIVVEHMGRHFYEYVGTKNKGEGHEEQGH